MKDFWKSIIAGIAGIAIGIGATLGVQYFKGPKQTVNITGQGVIEAPADQATISVTVTNSSWSQDQAEKDNSKDVSILRDKLLALGIPESRITLSTGPQIVPMIEGQTIPAPPIPIKSPIVGGSNNASTTMSIILDTISGIDKVYAAIGNSPNAKLTNTNYSLKSTAAYEEQARQKALEDVRKQVESIAKINHLHVGRLVTLNSFNPGPMVGKAERMMGAAGSGGTGNNPTYSEKTIEISASYNAQYELW